MTTHPEAPVPGADPFELHDVEWTSVSPRLATARMVVLGIWAVVLLVPTSLVAALLGVAWVWAFPGALALLLLWSALLIHRQVRALRYAERADDLLISRGVLWHEETVVPYGRMQLVEVTSGPVERHFGLASVQLHTAAAATDATIPGLDPDEAERLRDRLTELGEARSAGL